MSTGSFDESWLVLSLPIEVGISLEELFSAGASLFWSVTSLLLDSDELLSLLLNNPVNQFHIFEKKPSTWSFDGRFIASLSVASI